MSETLQHKPLKQDTHQPLGKGAQNAENIAYTINHALACTASDAIDPWVQRETQKRFNQRIGIGCGHDHGPRIWQNIVAELTGDFVAVPVTVAVQRFLPGVMDGIRYVAEPVMGDLFRQGAKAATKKQMLDATLAGYPLSKDAYQDHVRSLYHYEVQHLPQGLLWTGVAALLNVKIMKNVLKVPDAERILWEGKAKGAAISAGALFAFRGVATEQANHWDNWSTKHVFMPATKKIGHLFGIKEEDVQRLADKQDKLNSPNWAERTKQDAQTSQSAIGIAS